MKEYNEIRLNGKLFNRTNLEELKDQEEELICFIREWLNDSEFITAFTSGTTGIPKEIRLLKRHMVHSAKTTTRFFSLTPGENALLCLPAGYIAGKMMVVRAFVTGFNLLTVKPASRPLAGLNSHIDFMAMTPHQLFHSVDDIRRLNVKKIIVGGGDLSSGLEQQVKNVETKIYATYGMTETCSHVALRKINGENPDEYFKALPEISFRTDKRGCLLVHAPGVSDSEVRTNDMVDLVDEFRFKWLGRADNVINSGGIKIFPEMVEKKISGWTEKPFFIAGLPDERLTEKVVLFIEDDQKGEENFNIEKIRHLLLPYEVPRQEIVIKKFLYSSSGKILRKETLKEAGLLP